MLIYILQNKIDYETKNTVLEIKWKISGAWLDSLHFFVK